MKNISIGSLLKPIGHFFARFHLTLFILVVASGLGCAVLLLNGILTDTSAAEGYVSPIGTGSIDQATLDAIKALHTSDETVTDKTLPEGRINPVAE
jgi:hypothetical protein